jgi:hypothetical protein
MANRFSQRLGFKDVGHAEAFVHQALATGSDQMLSKATGFDDQILAPFLGPHALAGMAPLQKILMLVGGLSVLGEDSPAAPGLRVSADSLCSAASSAATT